MSRADHLALVLPGGVLERLHEQAAAEGVEDGELLLAVLADELPAVFASTLRDRLRAEVPPYAETPSDLSDGADPTQADGSLAGAGPEPEPAGARPATR
jgi:hypothetical protein